MRRRKWGGEFVDVHVQLPKWLVRKIKDSGFYLGEFLENAAILLLESLYNGAVSRNGGSEFSINEIMVPRPGFEPGARARKARMFDRATPPGRPIS